MVGNYLIIDIEERIIKRRIFQIGTDITQKKADQLLKLVKNTNNFSSGSNEYNIIDNIIGDEIRDSIGFENVAIVENELPF